MKVYDYKIVRMKRDMDLIRDILVAINDDSKFDGTHEFYFQTPEELGIHGHSTDEVAYHIAQLIEAGFIDGAVTMQNPLHTVRKLTWKGHELEANVRNSEIWEKTKKVVKDLHTVSITVIAEIAEAIIKKHYHLS